MNYQDIAESFCCTYRRAIMHPFHDPTLDRVVAADGRLLCVFNSGVVAAELPAGVKITKCKSIIDSAFGTTPETFELSGLMTPRQYTNAYCSICEACDGTGYIERSLGSRAGKCPYCDEDLDFVHADCACDNGKIFANKEVRLDNGTIFDSVLLLKIAQLPDCRLGLVGPHEPHPFWFRDGYGVIMPKREPEEHEDRLPVKLEVLAAAPRAGGVA